MVKKLFCKKRGGEEGNSVNSSILEHAKSGIDTANLRQGGGYGPTVTRLGILFICFFVFLLVSAGFGSYTSTFFAGGTRWYYLIQSLSQCLIGFIGASIAAAYWMAFRPWSFLATDRTAGLGPYFGVVIVYLLATPALNQLVWWNEHVSLPERFYGLQEWMRNLEDSSARITDIILNTSSVAGLVSGILIIGFLTGLAEEMLFRGALQRTIATFPPLRHLSIWIAAFIFSAMHLQFFGFFPRFVMGLFFGYLLQTTGSLWPGVWAHSLNNSIIVLVAWLTNRGVMDMKFFSEWGVAESGFPTVAFMSVIITVIFFIFFYKFFFCPSRG